jgi:hypothetical protein
MTKAVKLKHSVLLTLKGIISESIAQIAWSDENKMLVKLFLIYIGKEEETCNELESIGTQFEKVRVKLREAKAKLVHEYEKAFLGAGEIIGRAFDIFSREEIRDQMNEYLIFDALGYSLGSRVLSKHYIL